MCFKIFKDMCERVRCFHYLDRSKINLSSMQNYLECPSIVLNKFKAICADFKKLCGIMYYEYVWIVLNYFDKAVCRVCPRLRM